MTKLTRDRLAEEITNHFMNMYEYNSGSLGEIIADWIIENLKIPSEHDIDEALQNKNSYYFDLRKGNMLDCVKISKVRKGGFNEFMKSKGKLGGQNKTPRLSNDRQYADALANYLI